MLLLIIAILLFIFLIGILFSPIVFVLNSSSNEYFLSLKGFFRIQLLKMGETWRIKLTILFLSFRLNPFRKKSSKRAKKIKPNKEKAPKSRRPQSGLILIRKALKAITIKRCNANIDTNDYPLNAKLIAITPFVNQGNISVNINFENNNTIEFKAITYLYKLIGVAITTYIIKNN